MRTIKEEVVWLHEFMILAKAKKQSGVGLKNIIVRSVVNICAFGLGYLSSLKIYIKLFVRVS